MTLTPKLGTHRAQFELPSDLSPLDEGSPDATQEGDYLGGEAVTVARSRTLPSRRGAGTGTEAGAGDGAGVTRNRSGRSQRSRRSRGSFTGSLIGSAGRDDTSSGVLVQVPTRSMIEEGQGELAGGTGSVGGRRVLRKHHRPSQEGLQR
jgi:hypothetical protein